MAIERGTDTECYCVSCEILGLAIERGTDTECYSVRCEVLGSAIYRGNDNEYYCVFCECIDEYRNNMGGYGKFFLVPPS